VLNIMNKQGRRLDNRTASWLWMFMAFLFGGCAGASVASQNVAPPASNNRPSTAYVYNFAVSPQEVTLNQGFIQRTYRQMSGENENQSQLDVAHSVAQALSANIVQELQNLGFTATQVARGTPVSGDNILIVDGEFLDINEGNRLRRMVIGLGSGAATLDTEVHVFQMANGNTQQIMDFNTNANSGEMPGAAFTAPAGAAAGGTAAAVSLGLNLAAGAGKTYSSSMTFLAKRSADKAVAYMSQYFASQGWIPQSMVTNGNIIPNVGNF
jgi:hypothetical protein